MRCLGYVRRRGRCDSKLSNIVPYKQPPISPFTIMDSPTVGRAPKAPPTVEAAEGGLHLVDGAVGGSIYGTIYLG